jgi:hypothetical protein
MKFYIDIHTRRFVRSAAAGIPLETLFFKRRDAFEVEVVFVDRTGIVPTPAGTTFLAGIKSSFGGDFLALTDAAGGLNLHTTAVEALFAEEPEKVAAYFEIKSTTPGEETRTHTLLVDLQNAVILGDEGTPAALLDSKATQAEAEAGTDNEKWMTPLRTAEAISAAERIFAFAAASPETTYFGWLARRDAPETGSPYDATSWQITRTIFNSSGTISTESTATGAWSSRASLTFS